MAQILLLESDRQLAKTFKNFFDSSGYKVLAFADPQRAVTAIDSSKPDIIILNINLAGRSGIEFLHELRSYPEWDDIPVIVTGRLSQDEQSTYAGAFAQLKADKYIHLPSSSLQSILTVVNSVLHAAKV